MCSRTAFLCGIVFAFAAPFAPAGTYSGGSGTPDDPYRLGTVADWRELTNTSADWDKHFILTADLDFEGQPIAPVARDEDDAATGFQGVSFTGVLNGNGHTVSHAIVHQPAKDCVGLFGHLGLAAQVRNLGVVEVSVQGTNYVGALAGYAGEEVEVTFCYATGDITGSGSCAGGLIGYNHGSIRSCYATGHVRGRSSVGGLVGSDCGTATKSYATGQVDGREYVGGLVGEATCNKLAYCHAAGDVSGDSQYVGGLIGRSFESTVRFCHAVGTVSCSAAMYAGGLVGSNEHTEITCCYATGDVTGADARMVGGLAGSNAEGVITYCYARGAVAGRTVVGGLVARNYGTITACYATGHVTTRFSAGGLVSANLGDLPIACFWDLDTSGQPSSEGGDGKTTAELQMLATFIDAGWDFVDECANGLHDVWQMDPNDYPSLAEPQWTLGGAGTPETPYVLGNKMDLGKVWLRPDAAYVLQNDLDLSGISWLVPVVPTFSGSFDGAGHTIRNLTIRQGNRDHAGLFAGLGRSGEVRSLGVLNANIQGRTLVGGLAGSSKGLITSCYATGQVSASSSVGGLVGGSCGGMVTSCYATANVSGVFGNAGGLLGSTCITAVRSCHATGDVRGLTWVGGLAGSSCSTITSCYATGEVAGQDYVGGLVGNNGGALTSCHARGSAAGASYVGGLAGYNNNSIISCYARGPASGTTYVGGLVGSNRIERISRSYATGAVDGIGQFVGGLVGHNDGLISGFWNTDTSGQTVSAGGTGLTTEQMQQAAMFLDAGWDFVGEGENGTEDTWRMCADGVDYPRLAWEFAQDGDFDCPDGVGIEDVWYLSGRWLATTPATVGAADPTGDGVADLADLAILAAHWLAGP